ncbi:response regulator [Paenibacillus sedimenti]|uniref:Response regulator n=1 Tax=Paenibacillus sedimenti TaxID=2770274 RepID=A0A926KNE3_9BACL|nr:response regulator [Paenibacillus sedimenti]MBD0380910.1 response regulator [Paenibacillus sedimenti]
MIKVLLVDDEEWIRLGLREQMEWESLGLEIVGEAPNGAIALEMVDKYQPEIVVSDIRMPGMDGIQLMEAIHTRFPNIIIIVISGYSDFEYAKKAITFRVFDYILKPIEEEKLEETLIRAVQRIIEENNKKEDLLKLNMKLNESGILAKEKFLTHLVQGTDLSLEEIQTGIAKNGLSFAWPRMAAVVIRAENFEAVAVDKYKKDTELAGYVLYNVVHELIQDYDNSIVFRNYSKQGELILLKGFDTEAYSLIVEEIYAKCGHIIDVVTDIVRFKLYVGIGREFMNMREAGRSYTQAVQAVQNAGIVQGSRIIHFDLIDSRNDYYMYPEDKEKTLLYYLENSYKTQAFVLIEDCLNEIHSSPTIHPQSIRNTVLELTMNIKKALKKYNCLLEDLLQEPNIHDKIMKDLFTISELKEWSMEAASKAMEFIADNKKSGSRKTMDEIVEYLNKRYGENINLNSVADTFFVNPAYLSRIFKSETGYNFNEYLNKVRMDAALKLLMQENLKMNDISEMVGYGNVSYFLKKFKEYFGCTPTEYKRK